MTTLQQWAESDTTPWTKINENADAVSAAGIFAKRAAATTGLTWAYFGGLYNGNTISDGTVTLTNAATNYVVVLRSTGVVSTSTSSTNSLDPLYAKLYTLTTAGSAVTGAVDSRWDANGLMFNSSGASGSVTSVGASGGVQTVAGSAITGAGTIRAAQVVNAQVGTTYTVLTGDRGGLVTLSNAGAIAVTLPAAGGTFPDGWFADLQCIGSGTVTITPTTSTINGAASLALTTGQSARIVSDGTNYRALTGGSSGGGAVATDAIWDAVGDLAVGSGANTSVRLARGSALQVLRVNAGGTDLEYATPTTGSTIGQHMLPVMASAMTPRSTGGCGTLVIEAGASDQPEIPYLPFDATTQEGADFSVAMPESWNEGTITFKPIWKHQATSTNFGVVWRLRAIAFGDDDAMASNFGTGQTSTDTGGTTRDHYIGPTSAAITIAGSPAAGDTVYFNIERIVSDGGDTMAVDAELIGVRIYYTTAAETD